MADLFEKIKALPPKNMVILLAVLAISITSVILLFSWVQKADYQILYSNLNEADAGLIMQKLNEQKIPYKVTPGGIMVSSEKVYELRLQMAAEGLPQGGNIGFELFDKTDFTMTDFVQKLNYRRALQGELSRTIQSLSEVEQCSVQLAVPEKSLFATEDDRPKASVFLKMRPGRVMSRSQVQGIIHLVSSSVEGLNPKNVTVVDSRSEVLTSSTDETVMKTGSQIEYQRNIEKDLENRAISMLEPVVGKGKVKAKVAAAIDFTKIERTEEKFNPDGQVVRSELINTEKSVNGTSGGVPGVSSNLPGKAPTQTASSRTQSEKKSETINYEISKITSHIINATGKIKRLSVVVLVDGTYTSGEGPEENQYTPRTDEELQRFDEIVKQAVGFTAERDDKVSVVNMPFKAATLEELPGLEKENGTMPMVITVAKYLVPLLAMLLLYIFVVRPLIGALSAMPAVERRELALPQTVAEIEKSLVSMPESPDKKRIIEWAQNNPKDAGNLVKSWIEEK